MQARFPAPVHPGDRIGVAALSGAVDPAALETGLAQLQRLGFEPVPAANLRRRWGIFAGTEDERLEAFHELADDPDLKAIVFARGGSGILGLLSRLDWERLAATPRAYVGYSDLTPFLLEVVRRLGLVAFHGPMVATDLARGLAPVESASFCAALAGNFPLTYSTPATLVGGGAVEGPVLGGCLSLLASVQGTELAPDLAGSILLLEDVDEPPYRVDRMLTHLRLSGNLASIRGMVVGHLGNEWERGALEPWQRASLAAVPGPVVAGLACGHGAPNLTLPLGGRGRLDPQAGTLTFDSEP